MNKSYDDIIPGETVILDKDYRTGGTVEVVSVRKYFATVKDEEAQWDVMRYRLTKIKSKENDM